MLDIKGNVLKVGDEVIYAEGKYSDLRIAHVKAFTPKSVRIHVIGTNWNTIRPSHNLIRVEGKED